MNKIVFKITQFCCLSFSFLMHANGVSSQDGINQKEQIPASLSINNTAVHINPTDGYSLGTIDNILIDLPFNCTELKALLEKISESSDSSRDISIRLRHSDQPKWKGDEVSFFFLQSILNRNDSNALFIQRFLETIDPKNVDQFKEIVRLEQNQFILNSLNQDFSVVSFFKQLYHALACASNKVLNDFSGELSKADALIIYPVSLIPQTTPFYNPLPVNLWPWHERLGGAFLVHAMALVIQETIGRIMGSVINSPHWYQFDVRSMLSQGFTTVKYGMAAAAISLFSWWLYSFTKFAINEYRVAQTNHYLNERYAPYHLDGLKDLIQGYVGGDLT